MLQHHMEDSERSKGGGMMDKQRVFVFRFVTSGDGIEQVQSFRQGTFEQALEYRDELLKSNVSVTITLEREAENVDKD